MLKTNQGNLLMKILLHAGYTFSNQLLWEKAEMFPFWRLPANWLSWNARSMNQNCANTVPWDTGHLYLKGVAEAALLRGLQKVRYRALDWVTEQLGHKTG